MKVLIRITCVLLMLCIILNIQCVFLYMKRHHHDDGHDDDAKLKMIEDWNNTYT